MVGEDPQVCASLAEHKELKKDIGSELYQRIRQDARDFAAEEANDPLLVALLADEDDAFANEPKRSP